MENLSHLIPNSEKFLELLTKLLINQYMVLGVFKANKHMKAILWIIFGMSGLIYFMIYIMVVKTFNLSIIKND